MRNNSWKLLLLLLVCECALTLSAQPIKTISSDKLPAGQTIPVNNKHAQPLGAGVSILITFGLAVGVQRFIKSQHPTDDLT